MKSVTKATKYLNLLHNGGEFAVYKALAKRQKRFAAELVRDYGYDVHMALQRSYIWLAPTVTWDDLYDCNTGEVAMRHINGKTGAIGEVFTEWEQEEWRLQHLGYTPEEIAEYKVRRGF